MTRFIVRKTNWSKLVTVALTGASLTAPALVTAKAQAAPISEYIDSILKLDRNRDGYDDRDIDRDGDIDRDIDRDGDIDFNDANADTTTRTGIVTQDLSGDRFQIRADNGETFIVNLRGSGPASLQEGSRVRVTGLRNGNRITRATVQVLSTGNGYGNGYTRGTLRTLQGRVTRDLGGNRFEMTSQGVTYRVNLRRSEPSNLSEGDRVEVHGILMNGNMIQADRVRILSDNNGGNNNGGFNNIDFTGRVTDVQSQRRFTVRSDNGTTYDVRSDSSLGNRISEGDHVRVVGTSRNGNSRVINATRIQLRNGNGGYGNGGNNNGDDRIVDFYGIVRSRSVRGPGNAGIVTVETSSGRTYRVQVNDVNYRIGGRIHVRGTLQNGVVVNNQVDPA